jgi:DNA-binding transcriptional LysR family regulator
MPPDLIEFEFAAFCQAFQARYPEIRLRIDLSPRRVDLVSERFDVAVRAAHYLPDDATLVARKLCDMRQGLFASPDYLAEHGTPETPGDLVRHACLALAGNDGETTPWVLTRGEERWESVVQGPLVCNSPRLQREMALRGAGIAALPTDTSLGDCIGNGRLRRVLPDWWLPMAGLWCVMPGRRLMPARTRVFVDMLQAHMDAVMRD